MNNYIKAAAVMSLLGSHVNAASYVASPQSLNRIISALKDGDTVNLTGGQYGPLLLSNIKCHIAPGHQCAVPKNLTFALQPNTGVATFQSVSAYYVTGLSLNGLHISAPLDASSKSVYALNLEHISGANILNCDISDQTLDVLKFSKGIEIRDSSNIRIQGNVFHKLLVAINMFTTPVPVKRPNLTTGITVTGNEFVKIRVDGFTIAGVDNAVISGNYFHDFTPIYMSVNGKISKDHSDYIQFFSDSGDPSIRIQRTSSNITINDNIMIKGMVSKYAPLANPHSFGSQGIFIRSYGAPAEQDYKNFTIQNNFIFEANGGNGITLDGMNTATVKNNTIIRQTYAIYPLKLILNRTSAITTDKNVVDRFSFNGALGTATGILLAIPNGGTTIYEKLFLNYSSATVTPLHTVQDIVTALSAKPGGRLTGQIGFMSNATTAKWNTRLVVAQ